MKIASWERSVLILIIGSIPTAVFAQSKPKAEAQQHHDRGLSLAKEKSYVEAIAEYNRAYDLAHDYAVLYDLAKAYIAIDQPIKAVDLLNQHLKEGGKKISGTKRASIEAEIVEQEKGIATLTIGSSLAGAIVSIDFSQIGTTPLAEKIRINSGSHKISAWAAGYQLWEQSLDLAGGSHEVIEIQLQPSEQTSTNQTIRAPISRQTPIPPPPPAPSPSPPAAMGQPATPPASAESQQPPPPVTETMLTPAPRPFRTRKLAGYVVGGLGIGALAVGSVFGFRAISKRHDSDKLCPNGQCTQAGVDLNNQAKTAALVSDITIVTGLASIAVATYLLIRSPNTDATPSGTVSNRIRVLPEVGPGEARLALGGSW
jgi:hypothetical protein